MTDVSATSSNGSLRKVWCWAEAPAVSRWSIYQPPTAMDPDAGMPPCSR